MVMGVDKVDRQGLLGIWISACTQSKMRAPEIYMNKLYKLC